MTFYGQLRATYQVIIDNKLLADSFNRFREIYGVAAAPVPDIKLADFIIWSAGKRGLRAGQSTIPS